MKPFLLFPLVLALLAPSMARAQPASAQAEVLFRRGRELMAQKKFAQACADLAESQKLDPAITTLLNLAGCREELGQLATAWGLFLDAERRTRGAQDPTSRELHDVAVAHAAKLEPRVSTLTIAVPETNRVPGLAIERDDVVIDPVAWNQPLPIDGGSYELHATAPGAPPWSVRIAIGRERDAKTVTIPRLVAPARQVERVAPPPAAPVATPARPTAPAAGPEKWFCASGRGRVIGVCKPDLAGCVAFRRAIASNALRLTDCDEAPAAMCFDVHGEAHCAPDAESCNSLRDAAAGQAGAGTVSACELRESASGRRARLAAEAERAAHAYHGPVWSCTDSGNDPVGICKPQPRECEAFRASMLARFSELTPCHDQRFAQCFELGHEAHCAPSAEVCEVLRRIVLRQAGAAPSACHATPAPASAHRA